MFSSEKNNYHRKLTIFGGNFSKKEVCLRYYAETLTFWKKFKWSLFSRASFVTLVSRGTWVNEMF